MTTLRGKVRHGSRRGKQMGFPTANITLRKDIPDGIYASQVTFEGNKYRSLTFIGAAGTFGETERKAEVYLLSFDKNMYGKFISITLLKKLRENKTFDSPEALVKQMKHDTMMAQAYFSEHSI